MPPRLSPFGIPSHHPLRGVASLSPLCLLGWRYSLLGKGFCGVPSGTVGFFWGYKLRRESLRAKSTVALNCCCLGVTDCAERSQALTCLYTKNIKSLRRAVLGVNAFVYEGCLFFIVSLRDGLLLYKGLSAPYDPRPKGKQQGLCPQALPLWTPEPSPPKRVDFTLAALLARVALLIAQQRLLWCAVRHCRFFWGYKLRRESLRAKSTVALNCCCLGVTDCAERSQALTCLYTKNIKSLRRAVLGVNAFVYEGCLFFIVSLRDGLLLRGVSPLELPTKVGNAIGG